MNRRHALIKPNRKVMVDRLMYRYLLLIICLFMTTDIINCSGNFSRSTSSRPFGTTEIENKSKSIDWMEHRWNGFSSCLFNITIQTCSEHINKVCRMMLRIVVLWWVRYCIIILIDYVLVETCSIHRTVLVQKVYHHHHQSSLKTQQ
jgi:hypothetical protein